MIPAYRKAPKELTGSGYTRPDGYLPLAMSCITREVLGGLYELELIYPISAPNALELRPGVIIEAMPSPYREAEQFVIYRVAVASDSDLQTIYAHHLSYELSYTVVRPFSSTENHGSGLGGALQGLTRAYLGGPGLSTIGTATESPVDMATDRCMSAREAIAGVEGSICAVYGLEPEWVGLGVYLWHHRGDSEPKQIPTLGHISATLDNTDYAQSVLAYWTDQSGEVFVSGRYDAPGYYADTVADRRCVSVDASSAFTSAPTSDVLQAYAKQHYEDNRDRFELNQSSLQQQVLKAAQRYSIAFDLGDALAIPLPRADLFGRQTVRVVGIETDVLSESYNSITLDAEADNIVDTIVSQSNALDGKR